MPGLTLGNSNIGNISACIYPVTCFTGNVLVLAGGGGGSTSPFNYLGGGAGGMLECTSTLFLNVDYNISVGAGGGLATPGVGAPGSDSYFCINSSVICPLYNFTIATCGGGGGGLSGGSGSGYRPVGTPTTGVPGQGTAGGIMGGGGAGSSPPLSPNPVCGGGGRGTLLINGNDYFLGGGGAAGYPNPSPTPTPNPAGAYAGGCGGAGTGGAGNRTNALPNSGGGGGGGYFGASPTLGLGGSGVVIVGWCTNQNINYCVSPSLTYCPTGRPNWTGVSILSGAGTICFYKVPECIYPVDVLVVGGGGSGGCGLINNSLGGGGGAGGVILGSSQLKFHDVVCISVGGGGSGSLPGSNGTGSCFGNFCALGGGRWGCCGASAGGASRSLSTTPITNLTGTPGILNTCTFPIQGCRGGGGALASPANPSGYSGAGGGANQSARLPQNSPGPPTSITPFAYIGGNGCLLNITGIATYYGGGGGGWTQSGGAQPGGLGGGGTNSAGTTNTGGGGSSRSSPSTAVWGGGSGIVVVAYANTIPDSLFTGLTLNPVVNPAGAANTTNRPGYKVYEITGGTGTMQLGT